MSSRNSTQRARTDGGGGGGGSSSTLSVANMLPADVLEKVLLHLARLGEFESARIAACELCEFGRVSKTWKSATSLDEPWRVLFVRCSPAAIFSSTRVPVIFTPFTSTKELADMTLATATAMVGSKPTQDLYRRRLRCTEAADAAYRGTGRAHGDCGGEISINTSTRTSDEAPITAANPAFTMDDLSYTFELFELDKSRRNREKWSRERRDDYDDSDDDLYEFEDFVTKKALHNFCGPPNFVHRGGKEENLVWCCTTRADTSCTKVMAKPTSDDTVAPRFTIPLESSPDPHFWCQPWRLVVTATRDTDGKICQLADIRNEFYEWGGDSLIGAIVVSVAEGHNVSADGEVSIVIGDRVRACKTFNHQDLRDGTRAPDIEVGSEGVVLEIDEDGDVNVKWEPDGRTHWSYGNVYHQDSPLVRETLAREMAETRRGAWRWEPELEVFRDGVWSNDLTMRDVLDAHIFLDPGTGHYPEYTRSQSPKDADAIDVIKRFERSHGELGGTLRQISLQWIHPEWAFSSGNLEYIDDSEGLLWVARKLRTLEWH